MTEVVLGKRVQTPPDAAGKSFVLPKGMDCVLLDVLHMPDEDRVVAVLRVGGDFNVATRAQWVEFPSGEPLVEPWDE